MPPKEERLRLLTEGVQNDQHMRPALEELSKVVPVAKPSGPAASGKVTAERAAQPSREPLLAP
eukprot:6958190-Pyramimonas_sp.AAC.1